MRVKSNNLALKTVFGMWAIAIGLGAYFGATTTSQSDPILAQPLTDPFGDYAMVGDTWVGDAWVGSALVGDSWGDGSLPQAPMAFATLPAVSAVAAPAGAATTPRASNAVSVAPAPSAAPALHTITPPELAGLR